MKASVHFLTINLEGDILNYSFVCNVEISLRHNGSATGLTLQHVGYNDDWARHYRAI